MDKKITGLCGDDIGVFLYHAELWGCKGRHEGTYVNSALFSSLFGSSPLQYDLRASACLKLEELVRGMGIMCGCARGKDAHSVSSLGVPQDLYVQEEC